MTATAEAKAELGHLPVCSAQARKAEASALLRFAGALHIVNTEVVVAAEFDLLSTAGRLYRHIVALFGHAPSVRALTPVAGREDRFVVRVTVNPENVARQTGLIDHCGRPVLGMPAHVVAGPQSAVEAAWRGAFLAQGALVENGRTRRLEVSCPRSEAALALVGAARRLGVQAKIRESRDGDRVVVRDSDGAGELLGRMGAVKTQQGWNRRRQQSAERAPRDRSASFGDVNRRRAEVAGNNTAARVSRALEIIGAGAPEHLTDLGRLRIAHPRASLEELGQIAEPPLTKDALAGRLRRLLARADRQARKAGIPDTSVILGPVDNDEGAPTESGRVGHQIAASQQR